MHPGEAANTAINNSPQQYSETGKHEDLAAYPRLEDARNQVSRIHKAPIIAGIRGEYSHRSPADPRSRASLEVGEVSSVGIELCSFRIEVIGAAVRLKVGSLCAVAGLRYWSLAMEYLWLTMLCAYCTWDA